MTHFSKSNNMIRILIIHFERLISNFSIWVFTILTTTPASLYKSLVAHDSSLTQHNSLPTPKLHPQPHEKKNVFPPTSRFTSF